jgi:hypothetical protein
MLSIRAALVANDVLVGGGIEGAVPGGDRRRRPLRRFLESLPGQLMTVYLVPPAEECRCRIR